MKKPFQVKDYLRKQEWYSRYKANVEGSTIEKLKGLLSGRAGVDTISRAFNWAETPEGTDFWVKANDEFMDWYLNIKRNGA